MCVTSFSCKWPTVFASCSVVWKFYVLYLNLNYKMLTRLHLQCTTMVQPSPPPPPCIVTGKIRELDVIQMNLNLKLGGPVNFHSRHWIITWLLLSYISVKTLHCRQINWVEFILNISPFVDLIKMWDFKNNKKQHF